MRPPRLVATDLDGTLLRDDGTVSARTAATLRAVHRAGVEVVFVTARPPRWVDELAHVVAGHGVVICSNGAFVYDVAGARVLECRPISDEAVRILARHLRAALPTIAFAAERTSGFAAEAAFVSRHPVPDGAPLAPRIEELLDGATGKLLAQCDAVPDTDFLPLLSRVLAGRAVVADSGAPGLGEISAPGVTKGATLARWAAARGCLPADVWAFGDMPNDLPMLRWAGRSFAVANAHPAVLAEATDRCPSNEDDGVAVALEALTGPVHSGHR